MLNPIRNIFGPPVFDGDEEKSRQARYLNAILWGALLLIAGLAVRHIFVVPNFWNQTGLTLVVLIALMAILLVILKRGNVPLASSLVVIITWCALTIQAWQVGGINDTAFVGDVIIIMLAGLLLGYRASVIFTALTILAGWILAYLQTSGVLVPFYDTPYSVSTDFTVILSLIALLSYLTISGLRAAVERSNASGRKLFESNKELQGLRIELENRVAERTAELEGRGHELEEANRRTEHRVAQLQAIAEVARAIATLQNLEDLLPRLVRLISERFGAYHIGIFLIDDTQEYAVLSATNSEGGQRMLARDLRLRIGESGIVGSVAQSGLPRVAFNAGTDSIYFDNPALPNTNSEIALPLRIGERIIGVLDVHSTLPNAFTNEDVEVLTTLADQVSIAIENTRLFEETRKSLAEAENVYRQYLRKEWNSVIRARANAGFRYTSSGTVPLAEAQESRQITESVATGEIQMEAGAGADATLAIPIKLRGQVVGIVNVRSARPRGWDADELDIARAVAERVSLAVENARLLDDSQRRATKERTIGEITSKISASISMRNVLQIAVEELGRIIPGSEVVIQFQESNGRAEGDK